MATIDFTPPHDQLAGKLAWSDLAFTKTAPVYMKRDDGDVLKLTGIFDETGLVAIARLRADRRIVTLTKVLPDDVWRYSEQEPV